MMGILKSLNLYSSNDIKANLDENLFLVFEKLGYKEDFTLIDVRLGLGVLCSAIAGFAFYIDKYSGMKFKESINIIVGLVVAYFVFNGILGFWSYFVEKNTKFVGINEKGEKVKVSTKITKNVPVYEVELQLGNNEPVKKNIDFNKVYTVNGFLNFDKFNVLLEGELKTMINKKE